MHEVKAIIAVRYSVHLQPRYDIVKKPPMKGPKSGPIKTVIEKTAIANPRCALSNISEKTAATTASGQDPKIPLKNRQSMIVCKSLATATPMEKTPNPKAPMMIGTRLPYNSERGAQMIGPNAYPRT